MYLSLLGTNPSLSLAELERTAGSTNRHSPTTALTEKNPGAHLGGVSKIAEVLHTLEGADRNQLETFLREELLELLALPKQKMNIGLSVYGLRLPQYKQLVFALKKQAKQHDIKPRMILGSGQELSSASVYHNDLTTTEKGCEVLVSVGSETTVIARTIWVQNIEDYTKRDMKRPVRDMDVGMLPPKLAQIMVNLAGGTNIFDPYCGTGVILQEALLMGKETGGSDLSEEMVVASKKNLTWLSETFDVPLPGVLPFQSDARSVQLPPGVNSIVTEGYLGPIQHGKSSEKELRNLALESSELMGATLSNLHAQLPQKATLCIALPAWAFEDQTILPPLVDTVEELGYNRIRLTTTASDALLYRRDSQHVGRQLILLEKR